MKILLSISLIILGYLLGSIPNVYIMVKLFTGKDVRKIGSGNVGGLNAMRNVSLPVGLLGGLLDVAKGVLAVFLAQKLGLHEIVPLLTGIAAVAGHNWPLYLNFTGGKGVGTTVGVMSMIKPMVLIPCLIGGVLIALILRESSIGAVAGFLVGTIYLWYTTKSIYSLIFGLILTLFTIMRFRKDLVRYLAKKKIINP
ncbi:MAG: glycerol-3-phosphate 1-O-acyltransferase PlsY [Actinomycetia bacterium]|nr:glycerol-3-phosphate 1-O-acyltransferase PlsY [Actinomycetes bacterium]